MPLSLRKIPRIIVGEYSSRNPVTGTTIRGRWRSKNVQVTHTRRHVSRTATNTNLLFDRLHRLLGQFFTLIEFHEQHHAFVFLIFRHLTNYEAVRYPLNVVMPRNRRWSGKACIEHIVDFCGPKPDATRVPELSKSGRSTISTQVSEEQRRTKDSRIDGTQESVTYNTPSLLPSITRPPALPILDSVSST